MEAAKQAPQPESPQFQHIAPESGIVEIRPFKPKKTFGNHGSMGVFTYKRRKMGGAWDNPMGLLTIPGMGIVLNMDNEEDRTMYEIVMNADQWAGVVALSKSEESGARFYIINKHADAKAYLSARERKDSTDAQIKALKEDELKVYGLMFKVMGESDVIRASLYQMAETDKGRESLLKVFENKDRLLYEMIAKAEAVSDANNKKGLYHNQNDVYFWNGETVGVGIEILVSKIKKEDVFYRSVKAFAETK